MYDTHNTIMYVVNYNNIIAVLKYPGVDKGIGVLNCILLRFGNLISQIVPINY